MQTNTYRTLRLRHRMGAFCNKVHKGSVVDPDPNSDAVLSASFCRIRIGIQDLQIRSPPTSVVDP
jgi:hypothetical protein